MSPASGIVVDLLLVVLAYLSGSIPVAWIVFRRVHGGDIREHGSGNMGATNLMRFCGKGWAVTVLALDALKGALPVVAARLLAEDPVVPAAAAVAAVVGHCHPIFLGLRGGKGVATGLGVFAALGPLAVACSLGVFLLLALPTRYVSLGSLGAAVTAPLWFWLLGYGLAATVAGALCAALIVWRHRANIGRLLGGEEGRVGERGI